MSDSNVVNFNSIKKKSKILETENTKELNIDEKIILSNEEQEIVNFIDDVMKKYVFNVELDIQISDLFHISIQDAMKSIISDMEMEAYRVLLESMKEDEGLNNQNIDMLDNIQDNEDDDIIIDDIQDFMDYLIEILKQINPAVIYFIADFITKIIEKENTLSIDKIQERLDEYYKDILEDEIENTNQIQELSNKLENEFNSRKRKVMQKKIEKLESVYIIREKYLCTVRLYLDYAIKECWIYKLCNKDKEACEKFNINKEDFII